MSEYEQPYLWRYATKKFDPTKKVSEQDLQTILESVRFAPSSYGIQPWKFYLVESPEVRVKLWELSYKQNQVQDASHLLILSHRVSIEEKDIDAYISDIKETRGVSDEDISGYRGLMMGVVQNLSPEASGVWASKQVYLAVGFVLATLAQMHIDACPMEGFDASAVSDVIGATQEGYRASILLPFGYRAEDDSCATLKKVRFSQEKIIARL
jgi:nitroreductase